MEQDWWEQPICIVCDYWWAILGGLVLVITVLLTQNVWRSWLGLQNNLIDEHRHVIQPTITTLDVDEFEDIRNRLLVISEAYSSPDSRPYAANYFTWPTNNQQNTDHERLTQVVQGTLAQIEKIENLKHDWPVAYIVYIHQDSNEILGLFRGGVDNLDIGNPITAAGRYVPEGEGLHLDWLVQEPQTFVPQAARQQSSVWFIIISILVGIWTLIVVVSLISKQTHQPKFTPLSLLIIGIILLTGCSVNIQTVVDTEGNGFVLTTVCEEISTFEFVRQITGIQEFLHDRITNYRSLGSAYENFVIDDKECITFQNPFSGLGNITDASESSDESSWVYITMQENGPLTTTRYTGLIDTTMLYEFYPSINPMIQSEMRKALDEVPLTFSVSLPGEIIYQNADFVDGQIAFWNIPMNASREIVVESVMHNESFSDLISLDDHSQNYLNWESLKWVITGSVFLIASVIFLISKNRGTHEVKP